MKFKKILKTILFWLTNFLVLLIGVHTLYIGISTDADSYTQAILGITMMACGLGKTIQYLFAKKLTKENSLLFMFGLLGISFGSSPISPLSCAPTGLK